MIYLGPVSRWRRVLHIFRHEPGGEETIFFGLELKVGRPDPIPALVKQTCLICNRVVRREWFLV